KRRRKRGVLLLQPGPGPRSRGLRQSARATQPERRAGKTYAAVDRLLPAPSGPAADRGGVTRQQSEKAESAWRGRCAACAHANGAVLGVRVIPGLEPSPDLP